MTRDSMTTTPPREGRHLRRTIELDEELLTDIRELIHDVRGTGDTRPQPSAFVARGSLLNILADLHAADIADLLENLELEDARLVFSLLGTEVASDVLTEIDPSLRDSLLSQISTEGLTKIVGELQSDDAADLIADLPADRASKVLETIEAENAEKVQELLKYPEDTAGGIMAGEVLTALVTDTVKMAIRKTRNFAAQGFQPHNVYVTEQDGTLAGFLPVGDLVLLGPGRRMGKVMHADVLSVAAEMDQEQVANVIRKYDLLSLPVVNADQKIIGVITIDDIVDVIQEEATEDIQRMAGLAGSEEATTSIVGISRIRLPWLFVGFVGELLSAFVLRSFQASLEEIVVAAFFIPIIMAMGGNAGIQSSAIVVRGLATGEVRMGGTGTRIAKEFSIASVNGLILGALIFVVSYLWFHDARFGITVALALVVVILNATVVGATVPLVLHRLRVDPAIATGPFITTTNDALGLLIYFSFMSIIYSH